MTTTDRDERRVALVLIAACIAELAISLLVLPAQFITQDEGKYLGIGRNIFAGNGPLTVFGEFFPFHSPLWPAVMVAPSAWFGIDPIAWSHLVTVASACAVLALVAALAWRFRPAAGVVAGASLLAVVYFVSLGRTHGLDMPAAALSLAYVVVGERAVARSSVRLSVAAGTLFGVAFLIKEIALPFAPVPFLVGLIRGQPPGEVARLAAAALVPAALTTSWWFIVFAQFTGEVYRLGTPAWTLAPIAIAVIAIAIGWRTAPRWAVALSARWRWSGVAIGWFLALAWTGALTAFFAYTQLKGGNPFLEPEIVAFNLRRWLPDLRVVAVIGIVGSGLAVAWRVWRGLGPNEAPTETSTGHPTSQIQAVDALVLASLCGLPLILLVVSVGEIPRHYIAQIGIALALGSAGWLWFIDGALLRSRTTAAAVGIVIVAAAITALALFPGLGTAARIGLGSIAAVGGAAVLAGQSASVRAWLGVHRGQVPLAIAGLAVAAATLFSVYGLATRSTTVVDTAKADAVRTISGWVRENVAPGARVAFADHLAYETADALQGSYDLVQQREFQTVKFDATAPLGLSRRGDPQADDWIAVMESPASPTAFYGYQAGALETALRARGIDIWVLTRPTDEDDASVIVAALEQAPGVRVLAEWSWPYRADGQLETTVFGIDPDRLRLDDDRVYITPDALRSLVSQLERSAADVGPIATRLADRVVVVPDGSQVPALIARLRDLAER